jgi:hypothetical protein
MTTGRALVIGVGHTSFGAGKFGDLAGVATDTKNMSGLLSERGFAVDRPSGGDLTAASIRDRLTNLVDATRDGDVSVIYLTGHGYRYPDTSGDEALGWDCAFVCSNEPIPDDWFRDDLWTHARTGSRYAVMVDACHSDTMTLGLQPFNTEPVPPPALNPGEYYRLVLAACRDEETARDLGAGEAGGGVVTRETILALGLQRPPSYRALWTIVASQVRDAYYGQQIGTPQLHSLGPNDSFVDSVPFAPASVGTRDAGLTPPK